MHYPLIFFTFISFFSWSSSEFTLERIQKYLIKDKNLLSELYLDSILSETPTETKLLTSKTLPHLKIAIDPGHLGDKWSLLEDRFVDLMPSSEINYRKDIQISEGDLTLHLAYQLRDKLEKKGATVYLTRTEKGKGALPKDFFSWLKNDFLLLLETEANQLPMIEAKNFKKKWLQEASLSEIFRTWYNRRDLLARAEAINAFDPDITLILHFNQRGKKDPKTKQIIGFNDNFTFCFVPGAFMKGELNSEEAKENFHRLARSLNIEKSIQLSRNILAKFNTILDFKLAPKEYFSDICLGVEEGILCRNLLLLRQVKSPISYLEILFQDNFEMSLRLTDEKEEIFHTISSAIIDGVQEYLKNSPY